MPFFFPILYHHHLLVVLLSQENLSLCWAVGQYSFFCSPSPLYICRIYKKIALSFLLCFSNVLVSLLLQNQSFATSNGFFHQLCIICSVQVNTADNVFQRSHSGYISSKLVVNPLSDNVMRS